MSDLQDKLGEMIATIRPMRSDLEMIQENLETIKALNYRNDQAVQLARDLLDPEIYGYAVSPLVRDAAREVLGIPKCETIKENKNA